jgi:glycosyltransferase involved in cell wall biosynthesis
MPAMAEPRIAVIVVPRERVTWRGMRSYLANTPAVEQIVFVDGGAPPKLRRELEAAGREHGFELVGDGRHLQPNEARNVGFAAVHGDVDYVAYVDNDVYVDPGWLEALVACAEETGAGVVGPLTCEGEPLGEEIHAAHGDVWLEEGENGRQMMEKNWLHHVPRAEHADELQRRKCTLIEYHAMLVRPQVLRDVDGFDPALLCTREQLDFCLTLADTPHEIWFEPASVVHFVPGPPYTRPDLAYYMLRWNDDFERRTLLHFQQKWQLAEDEAMARRLQNLGWRRHVELLRPIAERVTPGGRGAWRLERAMRHPERLVNRAVTRRGMKRREQAQV